MAASRLFYVLCGLVAAAVQVAAGRTRPFRWSVPPVPSAASTAPTFSYIRVCTCTCSSSWASLITTVAVPAIFMLGYWFLIQLISGFGTLGDKGGGVAFSGLTWVGLWPARC